MVEALTARIKVVATSEADSIVEAEEEEEAIVEITMTAAAVEGVDSAVVEVVVAAEAVAVAAAEVVVAVAADSLLVDSSSTVRIDAGLHCPTKAPPEVDFLVDLEGWPSARYLTRTRAEVLERAVLQLEWEAEISKSDFEMVSKSWYVVKWNLFLVSSEEYTANAQVIMAQHPHRPNIIKLSRRWEATCRGKCSYEL